MTTQGPRADRMGRAITRLLLAIDRTVAAAKHAERARRDLRRIARASQAGAPKKGGRP